MPQVLSQELRMGWLECCSPCTAQQQQQQEQQPQQEQQQQTQYLKRLFCSETKRVVAELKPVNLITVLS